MGWDEKKFKEAIRHYERCGNAQSAKIINEKIKADKKSQERRTALKAYAIGLSAKAKQNLMTDCEAFVAIVARAAALVAHIKSSSCNSDIPASIMIEDLKEVLIGEGLTNDERNQGKFALEFQSFLDTGFKEEFRDGSNQVQHAMGGIFVAYRHGWIGRTFALSLEDEEADTKLYEVVFPLGIRLSDDNYKSLSKRIEEALCATE